MVKEVRVYKMRFFKNDDANGGAMNTAIKDEQSHPELGRIVIHIQNKKNGRLWGVCHPEQLLSLLETNKGIYEVITKFPFKVYFDIDCKLENPLNEIEKCEHVESKIKTVLTFFPNADISISGSVTDKKASYHFTLSNYVIHNISERNMLKAICIYINTNIDSDFDWKVYTQNRNMKAINQSKDDGRVQQIIRGDDWKKHLITCFVTDYPLPFPDFIPEVKEQIMIQKAKSKFDLGLLPKLNKTPPETIVWSKITPEQVIELLPCSKDFNHDYTHRVARFCHTNDISFEKFLSWISQKHTPMSSDIANKWQFHWNNLHKYPPMHIEGMKPILAYYYPDIKKDVRLREFRGVFDIPNSIDTIQIERLGQEHYSDYDKHKATILHLPMGKGKTAQTIDFLKRNLNFCWIGHRQSLHHNTLARIVDAGLECVDYQKGNARTKSVLYNTANALSICLNSLHYIDETTHFGTVVVDEIESLLDTFMGDFMGKQKKANFTRFCTLLKNAKKIVLIDAFITTKTIQFLQSIDQTMTIQVIQCPAQLNKTLIFKNSVRDDNTDEFVENYKDIDASKSMAINEIIQTIEAGKRPFIFYPFKKDMAEIDTIIRDRCRLNRKPRSIFYNADVDDDIKQTLKSVNCTWNELDYVITNSCITCGVNFDLEGFDTVWIFLAGFVKPRDAIQVTARIRHLRSETINVCFLGVLRNNTVYQNDCIDMNDAVYTKLYKNYLIEDMAPRRKAFEIFCGKAGYRMKKENWVINMEICKEMTNLLENTDCSITWEQIEKIDTSIADEFQNRVCCHISTMYERLCLQKYFFVSQFDCEVDFNILQKCWDSDYNEFFEKYHKATTAVEVFKEIQKTNGWETIFPTTTFKTIKIETDTLNKIFINWDFRSLTKASNKNIILKNIMNAYFGKTIVVLKDESQNSNWGLEEGFNEFKEELLETYNHYIPRN